MADKEAPSPRQALRAIPMSVRPAVVAWLLASADNADQTALALRQANRVHQDATTFARADYWEKIGQAAKTLAARLSQAKATGSRGKRMTDDVTPQP